MIPSWFPSDEVEGLKNYKDFEKIAQGGFGEVFRAVSLKEGELIPVAVKRLKPQFLGDPSIRMAFEREALFLKGIQNPQIPAFLEGYLSEEECFFIMQYIAGTSVEELLRNVRASGIPFPLPLAFEITLQLGNILGGLHSQIPPLIHGDVKPKNILITPEVRLFLIDFSLARFADETQVHSGGTYQYLSPENLAGENATIQTDLFGISLILFELLTSKSFVEQKPLFQIFNEWLSGSYSEKIRKASLPPPLEKILLKGLALKPQERFKDHEELLQSLKFILKELDLSSEKTYLQELLLKVSVIY